METNVGMEKEFNSWPVHLQGIVLKTPKAALYSRDIVGLKVVYASDASSK